MEETSQILISIVAAIYKVEKQLSKCIESLISQPGADLEIILVDDASPDSCGKLCDDYAKIDNRIKVIHHNRHEGVSVARNTGIDNAVGKWIVFVDGDDTLTPDAAAIMREYADIEADMILFGHNRVGSDGKSYEFQASSEEGYINTPDALYKYKLHMLRHRNNEIYSAFRCLSVWSKMWNREFLNKYNLRFYKGIKKAQDVVFDFLCSHYFSCVYVAQRSIYNYTYNDEAITTRCSLDIAEMYNSCINAIIDIINEHDETEDTEIMDRFYGLCVSIAVYDCMLLGIYHKDYVCGRKERIKWLRNLCSYKWVQESALNDKYEIKKSELAYKMVQAIIDKDYKKIDRLCCKRRRYEKLITNKMYIFGSKIKRCLLKSLVGIKRKKM